jgi:hypothetical protein
MTNKRTDSSWMLSLQIALKQWSEFEPTCTILPLTDTLTLGGEFRASATDANLAGGGNNMARPSLSIATGMSMLPEGNTFVLAVTTMLSGFLIQLWHLQIYNVNNWICREVHLPHMFFFPHFQTTLKHLMQQHGQSPYAKSIKVKVVRRCIESRFLDNWLSNYSVRHPG